VTAGDHGVDALHAAIGAWDGLSLIEPLAGGHRSVVWRGDLAGRTVSVRRSRRSVASLEWELDLIDRLDQLKFRVPTVVRSDSGSRHNQGLVVQAWLDGRMPESDLDWNRVAEELQRLHADNADAPQRPGCCTVAQLAEHRRSVDADLDRLPREVLQLISAEFESARSLPTAVIHGDPGPSNILLSEAGDVGFLDFDESRVDVTWLDLANLGVRILDEDDHVNALRLADAWEAANGWTAEPAYAHRRLQNLMASPNRHS
jgi:Ser/Thr protein kinase RdoA (MazF antagonist)